MCLQAHQNNTSLHRALTLTGFMICDVSSNLAVNDVCFKKKKKKKGFAQTSRLNAPHGRTEGRANNTQEKKRIIFKLELISYTENSFSPSSLLLIPISFPSPSLSLSRLKKGFTDVKKY